MPARRDHRSRGPYRTGIRRREQIIAAATAVFAEYGYAGGSSAPSPTASASPRLPAAALRQQGRAADGRPGGLGPPHRRSPPHRRRRAGLLPPAPGGHGRPPGNRGLLELFTTIAAEASSPSHPAHDFIQRRYTDNLATLATHLQQAVEAGDVAPLTPAEIDIEVRLVTAVLDGIGLQWLLDPSTDVTASVETYINRTVAAWRSSRR